MNVGPTQGGRLLGRTRMGMRRGLVGSAAVLLIGVSACSFPGGSPHPDAAVASLVAGLNARDVGTVDWDAGTTPGTTPAKAYDAIVKDLGSVPVKVSASGTSTKGDRATTTLHWTWQVGSHRWRYDTTARLRLDAKTWQVHWSPRLVQPRLTTGDRLTAVTVVAKRADITGAGGAALVTPRPVLRLGIDKTRVAAARAGSSARELADLVGIDPVAYAKVVAAAGPKAFVPALVLRRGQVPSAVSLGYPKIPGAAGIADRLPLGPTKEFAAAILGTVGPATAQIVKGSSGRVSAGDDVGLSGLEQRYDQQLAGTKGAKIDVVDAKGDRSEVFTAPPVAGTPVATTLDPRLERVAQDALSGVDPASALVAIRPSTGDLLAVASGPGSKGYNTATFGQYAPGSTFKIVSGLALLRAGLTPSTTVHCTPTVSVDGKSFKNYSDYPANGVGDIPLSEAFANSCNTAFINARSHVHGDDLASAAAALGLGVDHDLGFPAYFGSVTAASGETEAAADMIGQGKDLASPMAMAAVAASVAAGRLVTPRLLPAHDAVPSTPAHPLTTREAGQLRTLMRAVVQEGSGSFLAGLPGPPVLAKTGTAEYGTTLPLPTHAWMVASQGDLAVAVFVGTGASGSHTAGPILEQFLRQFRSNAR